MQFLNDVRLPLAWMLGWMLQFACTTANPQFVADEGVRCEQSQQCPSVAPVCDETRNLCVQCVAQHAEACSLVGQVCDVEASQCRACEAHAECASGVCTPAGTCAAQADVAYIGEGGSGAACHKDAPCGALRDGVALGRRWMFVTGTVDGTLVLEQQARVTVIGGHGAALTRSGAGNLVVLRGEAQLALHDLAVRKLVSEYSEPGPWFASGLFRVEGNATLRLEGMLIEQNRGAIVVATDGYPRVQIVENLWRDNAVNFFGLEFFGGIPYRGPVRMSGPPIPPPPPGPSSLEISRSTFVNNAFGFRIKNTPVDFVNNVFADNRGGIGFDAYRGEGARRFWFNTVVNNGYGVSVTQPYLASDDPVTPVDCRNNIVVDNAQGDTTGGDWSYSLVGRGAVLAGEGNRAGDPGFVAPGDWRLQATSQALDGAAVDASVATDRNGISRPQGGRSDMGAFEFVR